MCLVLLRLKANDTVSIKEVISELGDFIVKDYSPDKRLDNFKGTWLNRIGGCAELLQLNIVNERNTTFYSRIIKVCSLSGQKSFSFKRIENRISNELDEAADSTLTRPSATASTSLKELALKVPFSDESKQTFVYNFHKLDSNHFWYLDSTELRPMSVEDRLFNYGLKFQYLQ